MKKIWPLFLTFFLACNCSISFAHIDSLEKIISEASDLESKLKAKVTLGAYLISTDEKRARKVLNEVIAEAQENNLPHVQLKSEAKLVLLIDDNSRRLLKLQEKLEEVQQFNDQSLEADLLTSIGGTLHKLGRYDEAIQNAREGLTKAQAIENHPVTARAVGTLAKIYFSIGDIEKSKEYFQREVKIHKELRSHFNLATAYNNLGIIYKSTNDFDSALWCYQRALPSFKEGERMIDQAQCLMNIGILYYQQDSLKKSIPFLSDGLQLARKLEDPQVIIRCLTNLGLVYLELEDPDKAAEHAEEALVIARQINYPKAIELHYYILSEAAKLNNDYKSALSYYEQHKNLEDSLLNAEKEERIAQLEKEFQTTELKRENLESEKQKNEALAGMRASILIAVLLAVAILAIVLYYQRNSIKSDFRALELRQKALRAQINPHFLFNALTSIQSAILSDDKDTAFAYHNKFARLMRLILTNSEETTTSLKSELELIKLYIELEQLRSVNFFSVSYDIDKDVDVEKREFPSMVMQPIVENAIWHGLMNRETPGILTIRIWAEEHRLICEIEDNGVGREKAAEITASKWKQPSFGIDASRSRMEIYSRLKGVETKFEIQDLKSESGYAKGTLVQVSIGIAS